MDLNCGPKKILKQFANRGWSLNSLRTLCKKIDSTGTTERKVGSGRPRSVRTQENIDKVEAHILSQQDMPGTHMTPRLISAELGISHTSVRNIIEKDLKINQFKRHHGQKLSERNETVRVRNCKRLLRRFTRVKINKTFFSDEKRFTVDPPRNAQNDRVYSTCKKKHNIADANLYTVRNRFSPSVMVSCAVSKLGKSSIHFVTPVCKINADYYTNTMLREWMVPEMEEMSHGDYIFMQDGARSHTARYTIAWMQQNMPDFIEPENWPANSPDLSPVDYCVWEILKQKVYRVKIRNVTHLKERIVEKWEEVTQESINKAIDQWRMRMKKCVEVGGKHIEQFDF